MFYVVGSRPMLEIRKTVAKFRELVATDRQITPKPDTGSTAN
jgi:hypothetical protein